MRAAVLIASPTTSPSPDSGRTPSDEHLAGVDADPQLELAAACARQLGGRHRDPHARADRPLRVVLVRRRRAEDADHGVADELLDGPPWRSISCRAIAK